MADDRGIELRSIAERFAQSTGALDDLAERIRSLSSTSAALDVATSGIQEVAVGTRDLLNALASMVGQLREASDGLRSATLAAEAFLSQSDTSAIAASLTALEEMLRGQVAALTGERDRALKERDTAIRDLAGLQADMDRLADKVNLVPEKHRRKVGL